MYAYINKENDSISDKQDKLHTEKIELWIWEWNYILQAPIDEVSEMIKNIIESGTRL